MKQYKDNDLKFIEFVKSECRRLNVRAHIKNVKFVKISPQIKCSGYFDDTDPNKVKLACSMANDNGLEILVHEYCHMTQWVDQIPLWTKASHALGIIEDWLAGTEYKDKILNEAFSDAIALELDNEIRSANLITKWNLNIDVDHYVQKANTYLLYYHWLRKTRKWANPNNQPYNNERLINAMPNSFTHFDYKSLPTEFESLYAEQGI